MSRIDDDFISRAATDEELLVIMPYEAWWRDRYDLLLSRGYQLRPRLRPGWVPSWTTNGKEIWSCEDSAYIMATKYNVVDAVKTSNGDQVLIKKIKTGSDELRIGLYLSSSELREDPRNHCVPILDYFEDEEDETISFMVMPLLRHFDNPKFGPVNELLDFGDQIFEGLCFMHAQGVAHRYRYENAPHIMASHDLVFRDCANLNIMMNAKSMYPDGFHPVHDTHDLSRSFFVPHYTRSERRPKYYFIDFGISSYFPTDDDTLVVGLDGRDNEVPELSSTIPYNPYKTDIFIIGNLLKKEFVCKYSNVDFLIPLILVLTDKDPNKRPTAFEAQQLWKYVRDSVSVVNRYWRLREREDDGYITTAVWDIVSFTRRTVRLSQWAPRLDDYLGGL
ncbi:hypothetical protein NLI96_g11382 [Meripilus lineatus]|uniref:Protein kinase domain-containing protein n=1 Tax=Meripilus lineatus TaxID=2056292 RepID=A0AAD5YDF6_9APHY|nr:hypothetical protein NLI96_g11382 [Physisporinus lineatus]